jgi:hypothetical protein
MSKGMCAKLWMCTERKEDDFENHKRNKIRDFEIENLSRFTRAGVLRSLFQRFTSKIFVRCY